KSSVWGSSAAGPPYRRFTARSSSRSPVYSMIRAPLRIRRAAKRPRPCVGERRTTKRRPRRGRVGFTVWPRRDKEITPGAVSTSRFKNQIRDGLGLGYERNVTRLHLDRLRGHSLCHEALKIRIDGSILRRDRVPAWL